jgi:DNA polymerase III sliding clamp (beta) subunit (PCNA family)
MNYNKHNLAVAKIASKNETRPELCAVLFKAGCTVATDGIKLVEVSTPREADAYPKAMKGAAPFLVPAKRVSDMKIDKGTTIAVKHLDGTKVELLTTIDGMEEAKMHPRVDGTFPTYDKIFPSSKPLATISIDAKNLIEVLKILEDMNSTNAVTIKVFGVNEPVLIEAENVSDNQTGRGLVMPMRS